MSASKGERDVRPRYEPPVVEDVPIAPEERLLVACKVGSNYNPGCDMACSACSTPGS